MSLSTSSNVFNSSSFVNMIVLTTFPSLTAFLCTAKLQSVHVPGRNFDLFTKAVSCRLRAQIEELDIRVAQKEKERLKDREAVDGRRTLAEVNKLNAKRNMENALKNITSRPEGSRALTSDGVDPFSRRPTRPMNYWSTKKNIAGGMSLHSRSPVGSQGPLDFVDVFERMEILGKT